MPLESCRRPLSLSAVVKDRSGFSPSPAVISSVTLDELLHFSVVISSLLSGDNTHSSQDHKTRQQGVRGMTQCESPCHTSLGGRRARIDKVGMVANICNLSPEEVEKGRFHPWGPLARHSNPGSKPQVP